MFTPPLPQYDLLSQNMLSLSMHLLCLISFFIHSFVGEFGCSVEATQIAAMLQLENVFISPHNKKKASVSLLF